MLYVIQFEDREDGADIRKRETSAHHIYLEKNRDRILAAGGLRETPDGPSRGGMWIVEAESAEAAEALYRNDPFWTAGLRRSARVMVWVKASAEKRPI